MDNHSIAGTDSKGRVVTDRIRNGRRSIRDEPDFDPIFSEPLGCGQRWQYAVINTGSFSAAGRMKKALDVAGRAGWELVTIYDKSSNWIGGMEKGFMLMKRPVPADVEPAQWCVFVSQVGS